MVKYYKDESRESGWNLKDGWNLNRVGSICFSFWKTRLQALCKFQPPSQ